MVSILNVSHRIAFVIKNWYNKTKGGSDMAKTANINIRIEPETKKSAEELFSSFGITLTDAVNIFLKKSIMEGGLPFEMRLPRYNKATEDAINEARLIMSGDLHPKKYKSARELFDELDISEE